MTDGVQTKQQYASRYVQHKDQVNRAKQYGNVQASFTASVSQEIDNKISKFDDYKKDLYRYFYADFVGQKLVKNVGRKKELSAEHLTIYNNLAKLVSRAKVEIFGDNNKGKSKGAKTLDEKLVKIAKDYGLSKAKLIAKIQSLDI